MVDESGRSGRSLWMAGVVLSVMAASVTLGLLFWPETPCHDTTATAPHTEFAMAYNQTTSTLTIAHKRGDRLTADITTSLTVQIRPAGQSDYTTRYVLASDSKGGYPVERGAEWTFTDVSVNDRSLKEGDNIRIYWTGPDNIPSYCPNRDAEEATLANYVVTEDGQVTPASLGSHSPLVAVTGLPK